MQRNVEPSAIFLQAFNSVIRNFTGRAANASKLQLLHVCR